ncbi:MAG: hypothetical protein M5R36_16625 [Deltaproteobacteria bacterium]|nr:hypothetical protein [Deltaproteobacteria bacterium]
MTLKAHADAPLPDYAVDGEITMPDGAVNKLALNDFRLAFAATQDKATVRQLFVRLAGGDIDLRADLGLKDEMPLDATVQFTSLDIRKAMEGYGLTGIGAAGVVNGNVAANGRLGNDESP